VAGSNLSIKVTAETTSFTAEMAVAKARLAEFNGGLREAVSAARSFDAATAATSQTVLQAAENVAQAKAKVAELSAQMKDARQSAGGMGGSLEEIRGGLSRAFQITGIAAAVEGIRMLGAAIERISGRAIEIRALSEVLGVNTSQLQAMQVAAEESGTSVEVLARASEHLTVMLNEARDGSGKAVEKLYALGISTADIANPTFQLNEILAVLKTRLTDVSTAEQTRKALLQDLGARTALAILAIKAYDGSEQGVADTLRRVNGLLDEQTARLQATGVWWKELGTWAANSAGKAVLAAQDVMNAYKDTVHLTHPAAPAGPGRSASSTGTDQATQAAAVSARQQEALHNEVLHSEMEKIKDGVAAFGQGTAERLSALRQYAADAKKYYGSGNVDEVRKANQEVLAAERAYRETQSSEAIAKAREQMEQVAATWDGSQSGMLSKQIQIAQAELANTQLSEKQKLEVKTEISRLEVQLRSAASSEIVAKAREEVSAIGAEASKGAIERLSAERDVWQQTLAGLRQGTAQYTEVQRALNADVVAIARERQTQLAAIARQDATTDVAISRIMLEAQKENLDAGVVATQAAVAQKYAALKGLADREYVLDLQALANEQSTLTEGTAAYEAAADKMREIAAKLTLDLAKFDRQQAEDAKRIAKEQVTQWQSAVGEIENAESGFVSDLLNKRKTLAGALLSVGANLVTQEIANDLKAFTTKMLLQDGDKALQQGGLLYHGLVEAQKAVQAQQSETAQTAANAAGNTARTAQDAAGATASKGIEGAAGAKSVMADAAQAFSATYANVSKIPYVGWILAPAAAAAAYGAVAAYEGLASLDTGTNYVARGGLANIHEGGAIVPKAYNPAAQGGGGGRYASAHEYERVR
jgi:hypothetical protein